MLGDKKVWTALYRGAWEKEVSLAGVSLARVCYVWMPTGLWGSKSGRTNRVQVLSVHVLAYMYVKSLFVWILKCGFVCVYLFCMCILCMSVCITHVLRESVILCNSVSKIECIYFCVHNGVCAFLCVHNCICAFLRRFSSWFCVCAGTSSRSLENGIINGYIMFYESPLKKKPPQIP